MAKDLPWIQAIEKVLRDNGSPMHYAKIAEEIQSRGLRKKIRATPAISVNSTIRTSMNDETKATPFLSVDRGVYTLKSLVNSNEQGEPEDNNGILEETTGIVKAFGAYWSKDSVWWNDKPKLLGQQQVGADHVDFSEQIGVYLLYDAREVIYVGQATNQPILTRLQEHTRKRLKARWNRFSWFGLYPVSEDGKLKKDTSITFSNESVIRTLEGVLIEAIEPRQNRRGGDNFSDIDYMQVEDERIKDIRAKRMLFDRLFDSDA